MENETILTSETSETVPTLAEQYEILRRMGPPYGRGVSAALPRFNA